MVGMTKECQPGERKCPTQSYEHPLPPERQPLLSFHFFVLILLLDNLGYQNHYPNNAKGKKDQALHKPKNWSNVFSFRIDRFIRETSLPMCHKNLMIFKQLFNSKKGSTVSAAPAIASVLLS